MDNLADILANASDMLSQDQDLADITISHVVDRNFSLIYEISGKRETKEQKYVLKISTTERSCRNEYKQYQLLQSKSIRSLTPIYFSDQYNYLITKKEDVIEFDRYLKLKNDRSSAAKMFHKLGVLFKNLDESTGHSVNFDSSEFRNYVFPRIDKLSVFSTVQKNHVTEKIEKILSTMDGEPTRNCLISDFSLGNLHIDDDGEFVLLDMGDASIGNVYENIAYIYLNIEFGSLNQYVKNTKTTKMYFSSFINGYELENLNDRLFKLCKIKHLLLMISFVSSYNSASKRKIRATLSAASNKYLIFRYKRDLYELLGEYQ